MKKVLIIGANGFVGRRILKHLTGKEYDLTAVSLHADIQPQPGYRFVEADVKQTDAIRQLILSVQPDAVINASALSVPDYCEQHHDEAYAMNVEATAVMAQACRACGARFLHLSTDFVFEGKEDCLHQEEDPTQPINYYGVTKREGEKRIQEICTDYAILRVVVVYGKALPGQHGNICQLVKNKLSAGQTIRVVADQWRTPTWVGDIAEAAERLIHHTKSGIYHICGAEYLSIADMAYRVADYFHLDRSLIQPVTTEEMQEKTPRPRFSGLCIEKARLEIGYTPHTFEEGLAEMKD